MPLVKVNRSRIDREVVKHRAQCLAWPIAEHLACDHEYLAAVEVIQKRRELEPVQARPEVTVVEQSHLRAAPLPPGRDLMHVHRLHAGDGVAHHVGKDAPPESPVPSARGRHGRRVPTYNSESTLRSQRLLAAVEPGGVRCCIMPRMATSGAGPGRLTSYRNNGTGRKEHRRRPR